MRITICTHSILLYNPSCCTESDKSISPQSTESDRSPSTQRHHPLTRTCQPATSAKGRKSAPPCLSCLDHRGIGRNWNPRSGVLVAGGGESKATRAHTWHYTATTTTRISTLRLAVKWGSEVSGPAVLLIVKAYSEEKADSNLATCLPNDHPATWPNLVLCTQWQCENRKDF